MPPYAPKRTAASPTRRFFDPWNSSSTGHQRAENRLSSSTAWRDSCSAKLHSQFSAGFTGDGGQRLYDSVGGGSRDFGQDGRTETGWEDSVMGWRGRQGISRDQADIGAWVRRGGKAGYSRISKEERTEVGKDVEKGLEEQAICKKVKLNDGKAVKAFKPPRSPSPPDQDLLPPSAQPPRASPDCSDADLGSPIPVSRDSTEPPPTEPVEDLSHDKPQSESKQLPQIFSSLTVYINGTTMPLVSDHKLKHLLTTHGARLSIALRRRTVTHVILGKPNMGVGNGAGGGLAGGKLEKEILRKRGSGKGVRYVSVEWALESIKAGKRLSESRFPGVNIAPVGVKSVRSMLTK